MIQDLLRKLMGTEPGLPALGVALFLFLLLRYLLFAGGAFVLVWGLLQSRTAPFKLDRRELTITDVHLDIRREIRWSLWTLLIFTGIGVGIFWARNAGLTRIYDDVAERGVPYLLASILAMLLIHDAYFYAVHRLMHHPRLIRLVHAVHHESREPTPFAAFAFHPLEALIESGVFIGFVFLIPLHPIALFAFQLASLAVNVYGHLGHEWVPERARRQSWLWKVFNSTSSHHEHHRRFAGNYGLYTGIWDGLFRTRLTPPPNRALPS